MVLYTIVTIHIDSLTFFTIKIAYKDGWNEVWLKVWQRLFKKEAQEPKTSQLLGRKKKKTSITKPLQTDLGYD